MSKLSQPMLDALQEIGKGVPVTARPQTLKALESREYIVLSDGDEPTLTDAGKANVVLYFGEAGLKNDAPPQVAEWEKELLGTDAGDERISEYLAGEDDDTYLDRNYVPGDMTTAEYVNLTTASTPETAVEVVPGLEAYLDTPHVVPNRSDRRGWRRVRAVFNRTRAKLNDRRVSERVQADNRRKVRKGARKVSI